MNFVNGFTSVFTSVEFGQTCAVMLIIVGVFILVGLVGVIMFGQTKHER